MKKKKKKKKKHQRSIAPDVKCRQVYVPGSIMKLALIAVGWLGGNRFLKATHNAQVGQSRWKFLAVCEKKKHPNVHGH